MDLIRLYKGIELFDGLDDAQLQRLAGISQEETFDEGQVIFEQGDGGDKLYIVRAGQVEITVAGPDQAIHSQVYLGQGQVFGEMALLDGGKRSAGVQAVRDKTLVDSISRDDFTRLCGSDTAIGYIVMRNLAVDLSFKLRHRNLDPHAG